MGVPVCIQSTNLPGSQTRNRKNKLLFVVKTVLPNTYYADMEGLYGNMFLKKNLNAFIPRCVHAQRIYSRPLINRKLPFKVKSLG